MLIRVERLWQDGALRPGLAVRLTGGIVTGIEAADAKPDAVIHCLMPAPTDLQVNGGGGAMLNDAPEVATLERIVAAHRAQGTGEVLATLITDTPDKAHAAAEAVLAARDLPGLLGLHLEGPHIAATRRGTHEARHIRPLNGETVAIARRLGAAGVPLMVTLAPEEADADLLSDLLAAGAVVSAGHSAASAAQAEAGFAAGITCVTHLFNAMEQMQSRAPGLTGAAILSDAFCGIIADGIHVDPRMVRLAVAARPLPHRTFLVSDAMATVGGPDRFTLYGREIALREGRLVNAEGNLAGAHLDMVTALRNVISWGIPPEVAIPMATDVPRRAMRLAPRRVAPGTPVAGLLALDEDWRPVPLQTS